MELIGSAGKVTFDGSMVTIKKISTGSQMIPLDAISSVSIVPAGPMMAAIRFTIAGTTSMFTSTRTGDYKALVRDPMAMPFRRKKRIADAEAMQSAIMAAKLGG